MRAPQPKNAPPLASCLFHTLSTLANTHRQPVYCQLEGRGIRMLSRHPKPTSFDLRQSYVEERSSNAEGRGIFSFWL